ncbi:MAG: biopolymer transporter ExbD [Planctomycetes bacterium]|nr:biopolymer transporter ExbD [Planctomycetota bacterium]
MRGVFAAILSIPALLSGCDRQAAQQELIDCIQQLEKQISAEREQARLDRQIILPLPDASEAVPLAVTLKQIFIDIDEDGTFVIGNRKLDIVELEEVLVRATRKNPNQGVVIRAHKNTLFQHAVSAINACKKARIAEYTMAIED